MLLWLTKDEPCRYVRFWLKSCVIDKVSTSDFPITLTASKFCSTLLTLIPSLSFLLDGSLVLAASGLTGKSWMGSLWFYEDPASAPQTDRCSAGVRTEAGITDMEWIDENRLAIGSDTGRVMGIVWELLNIIKVQKPGAFFIKS